MPIDYRREWVPIIWVSDTRAEQAGLLFDFLDTFRAIDIHPLPPNCCEGGCGYLVPADEASRVLWWLTEHGLAPDSSNST